MSRHELMKLVPVKPTLWDRVRSITLGPFNTKDKALANLFGGGPTTSGVHVSSANILNYSAVWSAVTMVSDDIASLPLHLYRHTETAAGKGKERFREHPLYEILHDTPNSEMDAMTLVKVMQGHLMIYQNAYAEIVRDGGGRPREIWPLVPERVSVERDRGGRLVYRVSNQNGGDVFIGPEDMIHLIGQSHDGMRGCELVERARESFALGLAAEQFGAAFYGNGATMSGVISYPTAKPTDKAVKSTQDAIDARHQGAQNAKRMLALYNGAKYEQISVNPNEGQFVETRVFQIREVARWFKIPPHKLGDLADATFSNVEQMQAAYLESCIRPYLKQWTQQLSRKLIATSERRIQFFEFDTHGFLSVDATSRAELYQAETHVGSVTINEIRGYENRNPVEGGDVPFVQLQSIPLDLARPYWEASIKGMLAKAEKDQRPEPTPVPPSDTEADRAIREFVERVHPELTKEIADLREQLEDAKQSYRVTDQKYQDVSAAREELEQQRDEAQAKLSQTIEWLDGAKVALAEVQAERARERTEYEAMREEDARAFLEACSERDAALDKANQTFSVLVKTENEMHAEKARADAAESKVHAASDTVARLDAEIDGLRAERDVIKTVSEASESGRLKAEQERDALKVELESAQRVLLDSSDLAQTLAGENELLRTGMKGAQDAMILAEADKVTAEARIEALTQERDAEKARADAVESKAQAEAVEWQAKWDKERDYADEMNKAAQLSVADKVAAEQRAAAAERDKAIAEQTAHAANELVESRRQAEAKRMLDVIASHRALMVQAMRRILAKETDRARRHQATPQKLRAWMDTYYESESDDIAEALLPIVRAHLAWMQSDEDPEIVADTIAREHVEMSQQQLRSVVAVEDWNQALAQTLTRWEEKRPDSVADAFVREGLGHVRSL